MPRATASLGTKNYAVVITAGHHRLGADEPLERGGQDAGPTPSELLCSALCACTAITLRMYAERKGWPLLGLRVDVLYTVKEKQGSIERTLRFEGDLDRQQQARLADIAERTPVTLVLKQGLPISTKVER